MKVTKWVWLVIAVLVASAVTLAWAAAGEPPLGLGDLDPDFRAWFANPAALAVTVGVFTAYARTLFKLSGNAVRIAGLVIGIGLSMVGAAVGELERDFMTILLFGVSAGIAAGGGWDILTGLVAITAKVFGIIIPSGSLSTEPVNVRDTQVVVIEKEPGPGTKVDVEVTKTEVKPVDKEESK